MDKLFQYRLSKIQKSEIAQNLLDIMQKDAIIKAETRTFVTNWIRTGPEEKRKAFFDVWEIVLREYLPDTRPVLFRSCDRIGKKGKISSFTGRLECARRFHDENNYLIICDTKDALELDEKFYMPGEYKHTFYPLANVLKRAKASDGWGFSSRLLDDFIGEDEYIMKIDPDNSHILKWM